jgi:iron-sulfur cluster repair protein YtfE (RIC family)
MSDLNRLRDEHAILVVIARRLSAMITQQVPPPAKELYSARMKLASELIRHLKTEDWVLYPQLMASSERRVAETARAFSEEMGGLAKAFGDYANRWTAIAIESDWKGYRRETTEILKILSRRMAREERELYPLLETTAGASRQIDYAR